MTDHGRDRPPESEEPEGSANSAPGQEVRTTVVLRPPTPLDLPHVVDLWEAMHEEFRREEPRYAGPAGDDPARDYLEKLQRWFQEPAFMLVGVRSPLRPPSADPSPLVLPGDDPFGDAALPFPGDVVAYIVIRAVSAREAAEGGGLSPGLEATETPKIGRLEALYVVPSLRRNGLARRMLESGLGWLRAQNVADVDARILVRNRTGMIFLSRAGFQLFSSVLRLPLEAEPFAE